MEPPPGCPLTPGQFDCLRLIVEGNTYKQVAQIRGRSRSSIRSQVVAAYRRLGVHNSAQAVTVMIGSGWLESSTKWEDDNDVTAAQSLYLAAFDRFLRRGSAANRQEMTHMLRGMYYERELLPPSLRGHRDDHGRHHGIT